MLSMRTDICRAVFEYSLCFCRYTRLSYFREERVVIRESVGLLVIIAGSTDEEHGLDVGVDEPANDD